MRSKSSDVTPVRFQGVSTCDLYPDAHQALVHGGKGGKDRIVPLSSSLYQQIRLFVGDRRAGPIFEGASVRTLQRRYDQAIRAAGIEKKGGPHTARHTFATILRAKGFSLEEIQGILGHSSRVTTEIYAKLTFTPETRGRHLQLFEGGRTRRSSAKCGCTKRPASRASRAGCAAWIAAGW